MEHFGQNGPQGLALRLARGGRAGRGAVVRCWSRQRIGDSGRNHPECFASTALDLGRSCPQRNTLVTSSPEVFQASHSTQALTRGLRGAGPEVVRRGPRPAEAWRPVLTAVFEDDFQMGRRGSRITSCASNATQGNRLAHSDSRKFRLLEGRLCVLVPVVVLEYQAKLAR